ncbi:SRPBCC domain-containing protein [Millisia brevis]|uniref:SRPBCC domain-containing protein n=1 Tax=Millisia brevis TaxID=264148 RepID=UPI00082A291D|nr:SRPBCC domain-containing protein [Millisia brevis]
MPHIDSASRVVAAPISRVFAALVTPDALAQWLPPDGMQGSFDHFDPRPGGGYRMVLRYRDETAESGKSTPDSDLVDARFVAIEPNARVIQDVDFVSPDPAYAGTMRMTWSVTDHTNGTRVDILATDVPDGISSEDHAEGLASSLANLADYVERD